MALSGPFLHGQEIQVVADGACVRGHLSYMVADHLLHDVVQHADGIEDRRESPHGHLPFHQGVIKHPEDGAVSRYGDGAGGELEQI